MILVLLLMEVFPYSVLATYHKTFRTESARTREDSSVIQRDQPQELRYDFKMFPPPPIPAYEYP